MHEHCCQHKQIQQERKPIRWWTLLPWLGLAWLATGIYSVQPGEHAVVRRFGKALPQLRTPGLHFGLPHGLDSVTRIKVLERKREVVGMAITDRALGRRAEPGRAEWITGDRNLILVSAIVQYRVSDEKAFLFHAADVPALVRNTASSTLTTVISSMKVDDILTVERVAIQNRVLQAAQARLNGYGAGVQLTSVSLENVAPPGEVAEAFRDVTAAREDRARAINDAQGEANRLIPRARGEAERIQLEAEAGGVGAIEKARGEGERFTKMAAQLEGNRELTTRRLILETMERVLPRLKKIVLGSEAAGAVDLGIFEEREE